MFSSQRQKFLVCKEGRLGFDSPSRGHACGTLALCTWKEHCGGRSLGRRCFFISLQTDLTQSEVEEGWEGGEEGETETDRHRDRERSRETEIKRQREGGLPLVCY